MYHYQYVTKRDLSPIKNQIIALIHNVQDELREDYFSFRYDFIGSVKRNMVTYDPTSNIGFDFDVNIEVYDDNEEYTALHQAVAKQFFYSFATAFFLTAFPPSLFL